MIWHALISAAFSAVFLCVPGYGQLRIVQYNVAGVDDEAALTKVSEATDQLPFV